METSGPSSSVKKPKFIMPNDEEEKEKMRLTVDPDFADDDMCIDQDEGDGPGPVSQKIIDEAKNRRSREHDTGGVKMSIGNFDDDNEDEETEEERKIRFSNELQRFRSRDKPESFDFEEVQDPDTMKLLIRDVVTDAMLFNDNTIELEPKSKKGPKVIEGYLWGSVIGVGSYGKVKEVIDTFTLARRAAKIMKYDKIKKIPNGWSNIRSEISILSTLEHRNIIKMIEVFDLPEKRKVYVIFEYCIGSVQQLLDIEPAKRLTVGESHMIFSEMIRGLDYLHSRRISHKDIKPGNLLISIDFTIKICDFGVAEEISLYQGNAHCTKVNGTPKFHPPECVAGNHSFFDGFKADMWAAGVTLYNLVSGKYPFDCPKIFLLFESIAKDPVVMPTNVELSSHLQDLITKLLEKDFNKRIGSTEVMIHPWYTTSFPEDQGLGRIMERMRTGNRPLTMRPSMHVLFDGVGEYEEIDQDGNTIYVPPVLTEGGEINRDTFRGFKFIEAEVCDTGGDTCSNDDGYRPSSRSVPTSAPKPVDPPSTEPVKSTRSRPKRNFFSCIFRSRSGSS